MTDERKWRNVELAPEIARKFREVLRDKNIYAEPSGAGNYVHFECYVSEKETEELNDWLATA